MSHESHICRPQRILLCCTSHKSISINPALPNVRKLEEEYQPKAGEFRECSVVWEAIRLRRKADVHVKVHLHSTTATSVATQSNKSGSCLPQNTHLVCDRPGAYLLAHVTVANSFTNLGPCFAQAVLSAGVSSYERDNLSLKVV